MYLAILGLTGPLFVVVFNKTFDYSAGRASLLKRASAIVRLGITLE